MLEYDILDIRGNLTSVGQQQKKNNKICGHHIETSLDITWRGGSKARTMQMVGANPGLCK